MRSNNEIVGIYPLPWKIANLFVRVEKWLVEYCSSDLYWRRAFHLNSLTLDQAIEQAKHIQSEFGNGTQIRLRKRFSTECIPIGCLL